MFRFIASTTGLLIILGLYFVYGWVVTPLILPEGRNEMSIQGPSPNESREEILPYMGLFAEHSWERDPKANIQLLTVDQTAILFCEDEITGNIAKLKPCTLLFLSDDPSLDDKERIRQAVVLRTPQYAEIEFDGELNFSKAMPKIKGGKLFGPITVSSDMKDPGPQDDLYLETENVAFVEEPTKTTISTVKDVRFRWGYNSGEGTMLSMEMGLSNPKNPKSAKELKLVQFETLKRLNLFFPEGEGAVLTDAKPATAPSLPASPVAKTAGTVPPLPQTATLQPVVAQNQNTPLPPGMTVTSSQPNDYRVSLPIGPATKIDITCQREFNFVSDPAEKGAWIAGFMGNVSVVRTNPDGSQDFLTGEDLHLSFQAKQETPVKGKTPQPTAGKPVAPAKTDQFGNLEPVKFLVLGKLARNGQPAVPARLTTKQNGGVIMEGDRILYDLRKNQIALETQTQAGASKDVRLFLQNRYEIRSEKGFLYTMGEDGAFGSLTSSGKGLLKGTMGDEKSPKKVGMTWNAMQVEPDKLDPNQLLIQLDNGVSIDMEGMGTMTADKLKLWCTMEKSGVSDPKAKAAASPLPGQAGNNPFGENGTLVPERAVIVDKVHFENANGTCDVKRLDIFFEAMSPKQGLTRSRWTPQVLTETPLVAKSTPASGVVPARHLQPVAQNYPAILQVQYAQPSPQPNVQTPTKTVYSQNLLGFQDSGSPSKYAITGDQMKMIVKQNGQQSSAEQVWLAGNVRVVEKILDRTDGDLVEITGDVIQIWNPSTPETVVWISGKVPNEAVFKGKGIHLKAMKIEIYRPDNKIWIEGPGRLLAETGQNPQVRISPTSGNGSTLPQARQNAGLTPLTADAGQDNRLLVDWNESMEFNGETIKFIGSSNRNGVRVRALYQNQKLVCDIMMIDLNRFVSLFDDKSDVKVEPEVIRCAKDVTLESRQYEVNGTLKSYDRGAFSGLQVYLKSNDFVAAGPGELRSTFLGSSASINGKASKPGALGNKVAPPGASDELSYLGIWFNDQIRGRYLGEQRKAEIEGRVQAVYCPVLGWDDEISVDRISAATRQGYLLQCERLHIVQIPEPGMPDKNSMELTAIDNAIIDGDNNGFYGKARTIKYNQAKGLVIFDGDAKIITNGSNLPGQRIEYNLNTGAASISHGGGLSIGP